MKLFCAILLVSSCLSMFLAATVQARESKATRSHSSNVSTSSASSSSSSPTSTSSSKSMKVTSRTDNSKKLSEANKAKYDMQTVMQQHLIGPRISYSEPDKEMQYKSGKEDGKKGKLQTMGSVLGDIIGVLISEIARFFGSVVSDVAREVTAHGFVSIFKQFADLTGISGSVGNAVPTMLNNQAHR